MKTLVLGLGNSILGDDGVGLHVACALEKMKLPSVTVAEGGVTGLDFLEVLAGYDRAIIIDSIQTRGGTPGQIYRLKPEVFTATRHAGSPHDVNFATALELGKQLGLPLPRQIIIFGIEAENVTTFSEECTPEVVAAIPRCVDMVVRELDSSLNQNINIET
ncbi:MAG: hydrogenase maturation protease [Dehalococcoidales bacterium]|nr:hydrogenase maturation protease [Dehalococcoidales bacterium]